MPLSEADTRAKLIDLALRACGWTEDLIRREEALAPGRNCERSPRPSPAGTHYYNYDALYRLTNPTYPGQSDAYIYDANGNRTLYNEVQYSYDAADQLTCARFWWEQWCPSGGTAYGYDANGNQTSRGTDTFGYDHENRLTSTSIGGVSGTYTYNGDGLRASRNIGGTNVSYTWDVAAGLPVILQDSQGNSYVYGLDLISATDSGGAQTYFLYDGLDSTTDLVDGSGTVNATYSYDVFGAIRSQSGSSPNYWLFAGEQRDADSSLYYLRTRYYDPATGRFLTKDKFLGHQLLPASFNPYLYVLQNPTNFVDPSGYWGFKSIKNAVSKPITKAAKAVSDGFEATAKFAKRFGTLNCLSAALAWTAIAANIVMPGSGLIVGAGGALLYAAMLNTQLVSWTGSTAVNLASIDKKEGISMNNTWAVATSATDFAALQLLLIHPTAKIWPAVAKANSALGVVGLAAAGVSTVQCASDVL